MQKIKELLKSKFPAQTRWAGDLYRWIFRIRHDFGEELRYRKAFQLAFFKPHYHVLEVGKCNTQTRKMAEWVNKITVCDITGVDYEKPKYGPKNIKSIRGDICTYAFEANSFDIVFVIAVLEHINDDKAAAANLFRVLKPGGQLIVYVPDTDQHLKDWKEGKYPDHVRPGYTIDSMVKLLENAGFKIDHCQLEFSCYSAVAGYIYYGIVRHVPFFRKLPNFFVKPFIKFAALDDKNTSALRWGLACKAIKPENF